jgi:hypothetical protein
MRRWLTFGYWRAGFASGLPPHVVEQGWHPQRRGLLGNCCGWWLCWPVGFSLGVSGSLSPAWISLVATRTPSSAFTFDIWWRQIHTRGLLMLICSQNVRVLSIGCSTLASTGWPPFENGRFFSLAPLCSTGEKLQLATAHRYSREVRANRTTYAQTNWWVVIGEIVGCRLRRCTPKWSRGRLQAVRQPLWVSCHVLLRIARVYCSGAEHGKPKAKYIAS